MSRTHQGQKALKSYDTSWKSDKAEDVTSGRFDGRDLSAFSKLGFPALKYSKSISIRASCLWRRVQKRTSARSFVIHSEADVGSHY